MQPAQNLLGWVPNFDTQRQDVVGSFDRFGGDIASGVGVWVGRKVRIPDCFSQARRSRAEWQCQGSPAA